MTHIIRLHAAYRSAAPKQSYVLLFVSNFLEYNSFAFKTLTKVILELFSPLILIAALASIKERQASH